MTAEHNWHPAVEKWFRQRFPLGPTEPQSQAWEHIAAGRNTLLSAPTGSGKTLAALLLAVDRLYKEQDQTAAQLPGLTAAHTDPAAPAEKAAEKIQVVYVSPLKALATDIRENLEQPLEEIAECARELGLNPPDLSVFVRSGDTSPTERSAMLRNPPSFVITTPESFYLLLTAEKSREMLRTTQLVIVDEIHAVARDKRGSHLALSLERLDHICHTPPQRVGLSATQRPLDQIADLLVGADRPCEIIDSGHLRQLDLTLHLPDSDLEAVASHEQTREILLNIADQVDRHATTLVFVNTRRMAERIAHQLSEIIGDEQVAAHHGSLSKERRLRVENRLRSGDLKVLVATASLELGIDIGPVELVCQLGSPRSIAVFLQRVGRSNHSRQGTPKGRLYPQTRDELVECAALMRAVRRGRLDSVEPPVAPKDILVQQIVAECAAQTWPVDDLFELIRRAAPYRHLTRNEYHEALDYATQGVTCGFGPKGAYLRWNRANQELSARRGAKLAAITSGGAIPDVADYRVVLDPDETFIGTVNEDWAVESNAGDIFLLGSHSWRIRRVETGVVRVTDADGQPPTTPFWLGEAPGRTAELSQEVGHLLEEVETYLRRQSEPAADLAAEPDAAAPAPQNIITQLTSECGISAEAANFIFTYLSTSRQLLKTLPSHKRLVVERFFDETGGMQLVLHSPNGSRINRALGLALRKRFCRTFDFELQAAANDNAVVLSLGPQHSFPLEDIAHYVSAATVEDVLHQAVLPTPIFAVRWRWNLNRALTVLRFKRGKRNPPQIQRMESDDVMAAVFPSLAACQDNNPGPNIDIPDHLIVRQTIDDAMSEALDLRRLKQLLTDLESGAMEISFIDTPEASVLSHEILNGKPYTYLDDAPLEERRTQAVVMRRGLDPASIASLDADAIDRVKAEVAPDPSDADELHDVLLWHVAVPARADWQPWFDQLEDEGRAGSCRVQASHAESSTSSPEDHDAVTVWYPTELQDQIAALWPDSTTPAATSTQPGDAETAAVRMVRGHLDSSGPVTLAELSQSTLLKPAQIKSALAELEHQGYALQGNWLDFSNSDTPTDPVQWCSRRLLQRIYHYSKKQRRSQIKLATAQDYMRFLLRWQNVAPNCQARGLVGLQKVIGQLQGWEMPAVVWEDEVFRRRVKDYSPDMLDQLCLSGEVVWGRLSISSRAESEDKANSVLGPSKATPVSLLLRGDLDWLLAAIRGANSPQWPTLGATAEILTSIQQRGPRFLSELLADTNRLPEDLESGLRDGIARGLLTSDSFTSLRLLLNKNQLRHPRTTGRPHLRRTRFATNSPRATRTTGRPWSSASTASATSYGTLGATQTWGAQGRWVLLTQPELHQPDTTPTDELAEIYAEQLLRRWGIIFRDLFMQENCALPWREILWALRRLEARGVILGGRFVSGFVGEQYALPAAADELRFVAKQPRNQQRVTINATDPLNLTGIITGTERIASIHTRHVDFVDGLTPQQSEFLTEEFPTTKTRQVRQPQRAN